jgi:hypothetical protein
MKFTLRVWQLVADGGDFIALLFLASQIFELPPGG